MDFKVFFTIFTTVFLAELGDKTQIATLLFASDKEVSKLTVFLGAALALVATSAIGVFGGEMLSRFIKPEVLPKVAGTGFIIIGIWMVFKN